MAEDRLVEFGIISASNLKDVNYVSKMETYAVLTFAPYVEYTTQVDRKGGVNPRWDEKLGFLVPEEVLSRGGAHLKVEIFTLSTLGPKFVSEVDIPIADLTVSTHFKEPVLKRYPLKTNSGDYHGDLHVSFSLGDKVVLKKGEQHPQFPIFRPQASSGPPHAPSTAALPSYSTPPSYATPPSYSRPSQVRFNGGLPSTTTTTTTRPLPPSYANGLQSTVAPPHRRPATPPPSIFESSPSSPFSPLSSRPKPTPPFEPSLPLVVRDGDDTFPPSYVSPLSARPSRPPPQPPATSTFTKPSPYGPPYAEGDSTTYHPIKPPRASSNFGPYGYNEPTSRSDEPMSTTPFDRSGYGRGDDYAMKGPKFGTSGGNVPITSMNEETTRFPPFEQGGYGGATKYGYQPSAATDVNHIFASPIGKLVLTELSKTTAYDRRY